MTTVKKQRATNAGSFVDEILNDILSAPDQEILEDDTELTEISGESAGRFVERAMQASVTALGKKRFAETAAELRQNQKKPQSRMSPTDAENERQGYLESLKKSERELSLAARRGTKVSKSDLDSAIDDLTELRAAQKKRQPKK